MKLGFALFADYALAHEDGKVYIVGGGLQRVLSQHFPLTIAQLSLVVRVDFEQDETGKPHRIAILGRPPTNDPPFIDADTEVKPLRRPSPMKTFVHVVLNMQGITLVGVGAFPFAISVDGEEVGTVTLYAEQGVPKQQSTQERDPDEPEIVA